MKTIHVILVTLALTPGAYAGNGPPANVPPPFQGGAGGNATANPTATARSGDTTILGGSAVGIGGAWECGSQYGIGSLFLSLAWTSDHELCTLGYQMRHVCAMPGQGERCQELRDRFAAWEPDAAPTVTPSKDAE